MTTDLPSCRMQEYFSCHDPHFQTLTEITCAIYFLQGVSNIMISSINLRCGCILPNTGCSLQFLGLAINCRLLNSDWDRVEFKRGGGSKLVDMVGLSFALIVSM